MQEKSTMQNKEKKSPEEETSSKAVVERGKKAVDADEKINKKNPQDPQVKKDREKDAEQWRNEG